MFKKNLESKIKKYSRYLQTSTSFSYLDLCNAVIADRWSTNKICLESDLIHNILLE